MIEVTSDIRESDLTSGELVGISVMLTHNMGEPHSDDNVYFRARQKIQPQVQIAIEEVK